MGGPTKRRNPAADEDTDMAEDKKRRGPISCKSCKRKPAQAPWAESQVRAGQTSATGDKCLQCFQSWQKGFSYLSWDGYCQHMLSEA
eukprot:2605293-Amphidinium_carterae.1